MFVERKLCGFVMLLAAACLGLAGCGGGGKKTLYVTGQGSSVVENFTVPGNGALVANGSVSSGANPSAVIVDPQQKYAFVANAAGGVGPGAVSQYTVGGNGQMSVNTANIGISTTSATIPPAPVGVNPVALAIDPGGKFLFVANQGSNSVSVFTIDRSTGVLAEVSGSPFATGAAPSGVAATSKAVYVANAGAGTISAYTYASSGALTAVSGSPFAAGSQPSGLALANNDTYLYAADPAGNSVLAFTIGSSGELAAVSGSPFAAGTTPVHVAAHDKFLFAANSGSNNVSMFNIGSSGALTGASGSPFAAGANPAFVDIDNGGNFVFVANSGSGSISVFQLTSSGMTEIKGSPFASSVLSPTGLASVH